MGPGLAILGLLWVTNWWCTRRALRGTSLASVARPPTVETALARGAIWGGANGALFLEGLVQFGLAVPGLLTLNLGLLAFALIFAVAGGAAALLIDAAVGLVFAAFDTAALRIAGAIVDSGGRK